MATGPEFFQTRMGMRFFEVEVPRIVSALERIAAAMEKANEKVPPPSADATLGDKK